MRVIELFKQITLIPRCSGTHQPFIKYIQKFAQNINYICKIDDANNILCYKENITPKICLQSHYDIVCLEDGKVPQVIEEDGYLKAKDSTLGADNGIGCAYMLALMEENANAEFLFTCDEEIGLIGASNIKHNLQSFYMLNLDSEAEAEICIGCAGGVDIFATNNNNKYTQNIDNKTLYEITIDNLDGGHSGVDIDKNIPNALKLIAKTIKECEGDLLDLNGGQRINSIPKSAKAIIASNVAPNISHKNMSILEVETTTTHYKKLDDNIISFIYSFANGVRGYDKELNSVLSSINLAIITNNIDEIKFELSARSMDNEELKIIKDETVALLKIFNFEVTTSGKYPAWKPERSQFTSNVLKIYKKHIPTASLEAIHAGLECAIFKEKYPNMQICSIGPNIYFPHSNREECEISSAIKLYNITKDIVNSIE
ncbi:MAG: M20/M25/M40 family metallo-hydrolase [Campylobacterota bacterium]|nr:M20/M25/M40 family metallo-hydrolase [Campylobacterota bacterium]